MITSSTYPVLYLNQIKSSEGTFEKKALYNKGFLTTDDNTIFQPYKNNINLSIPISIKKKKNGFLAEILFHGFNLSSKRFKLRRPKYYIDMHKSEIYICDEPVTNTIKSRVHKRRLIFFSYDKDLLYKVQKIIKEFKIPDSYTGKGFFERNDSYEIKKRKKRK